MHSVAVLDSVNGPHYTTRQIAGALRMNQSTIVRWCQQGYLPALLIGGRWRIYRAPLEAWLTARRNVPSQVGSQDPTTGSPVQE